MGKGVGIGEERREGGEKRDPTERRKEGG